MSANDPMPTTSAVLTGLPAPRLRPFLDAAEGDEAKALELYAWNARMAGAALEQLSHLEVLLRHAIDVQLSRDAREDSIGIPWFLLPQYVETQSVRIDEVRNRLRPLNRETRDQIVAGLSFGFWSGWFGTKYEDLWRQALRHAFPHGTGRRKEVSTLVEQIRKFRNRIAHHDSLLNVDIGFEMQSVFRLAGMINIDAATWMRSVDRTHEVGSSKPITVADTVVVPAADAWSFYEDCYAYICQAGRYFQQVEYIAFYEGREIKKQVPRIKTRLDNVLWSSAESKRLEQSGDRTERKLGAIMKSGLERGRTQGTYQVFMLSRPGDPDNVTLDKPFINERTGKSSAFVRKHRYTSIHQMRHAKSIWEL